MLLQCQKQQRKYLVLVYRLQASHFFFRHLQALSRLFRWLTEVRLRQTLFFLSQLKCQEKLLSLSRTNLLLIYNAVLRI